jgi:hypothetical protein
VLVVPFISLFRQEVFDATNIKSSYKLTDGLQNKIISDKKFWNLAEQLGGHKILVSARCEQLKGPP